MADILLKTPILSGLGIGFWKDFQAQLDAVVSTIQENDYSEDSHDSSSDSLEQDNTLDPDVTTITELRTAVTAIISALSGVV